MIIRAGRFLLRDFIEADRVAFVAYQMDARYRRLYDLGEDDRRAHDLFDLFLGWQAAPRENFQLGVFDASPCRLCGCAGLRQRGARPGTAALGIELTPDNWGRYRLALDVVGALVAHGFRELGLDLIVGDAASGNRRVERPAKRFGARMVARRPGPAWMTARGWQEVDWALARDEWTGFAGRAQSARS